MKKITLKLLMLTLLFAGANKALADDIKWTGQTGWTGIGGATISLTSGDYTVTAEKNNGSTNPTVNANAGDLRAYAKATVTIASSKKMNTIVFKISAQGKKRMTDITSNVGEVKFDDKAWTLTWTGNANSVSFTVGDKATLGTDGAEKAGQFDVDSPITVVAEGGGAYVAAPVITPATGTFTEAQTVTISVESGLTAYYKLNGGADTKYTAPFTVSQTTTVEAYAQDANGNKSSTVTSVISIVDLGNLVGNGTAENPYDVASALKVINAGAASTDKVYVKGKISQIDNIDTGEYGNATYFISDDGTTNNQLEVYRGYYLNGEHFTDANQIKVGDNVVVWGVLVLYNGNTPEFTQGNQIVSHNGVEAVPVPTFSLSTGIYSEPQTLTISAQNGLKILYSLDNVTYNYYYSPISITETTTVYACAEDKDGNKSASVSVTITISTGQLEGSGSGTKEDPYDVARALSIITSGTATNDNVYVKGVIASIEQVNTNYGDATYNIIDKGKDNALLKVFQGKFLGNTNFTNADQIKINDVVVVCGVMSYYQNTTPEINKGNYIYELNGNTEVQGDTYKSIAEAKDAATADKVNVTMELSNVLITFVNGQNTYIADDKDGFLLYGSNLNLVEGQKANFTVKGQLYLYNGLPELAVSSISDVNVISEGNKISSQVVEICDLNEDRMKYSNLLVTVEGVGLMDTAWDDNRKVGIVQDGEEAAMKDQFRIAADVVLDDSKDYNITGFMAIYAKGTDVESVIYPRKAEDIQMVTNLQTPESAWSVESFVATSLTDPVPTFSTNSDGAVTFTTSDETVAKVDSKGKITLVGPGKCTITAETAETSTFLLSKTTLPVKVMILQGQGTEENPYTVTDALLLYNAGEVSEEVWVKGIIVGGVAGTSIDKAVFAASDEKMVASNVIIADNAATTDINMCLPVNLPTDPKDSDGNVIPSVRGKVNLLDNPGNYQKEVLFLGKIQDYFKVAGLKDVKDAIINGEHASGIADITVDNITNGAIYTLSGQRINQITRGGIYIINGKKVLVK